MGGKSTKLWEHGNLQVITDGNHFVPGQTVTGHIIVELDSAYPGKQLTLELVGVEKVLFTTHNRRYKGVARNKAIPVHIAKIVQSFPSGVVVAGRHTFPFRITLPENLQSSFVYCEGFDNPTKLRIKYKLRAII